MKSLRIFLVLLIIGTGVFAQKTYRAAAVAFYNVENLFDTVTSVGYIDGTKAVNDPAFHRSFPLEDTLLLTYQPFFSRMTRANLKGKKVLRRLIIPEEFTPNGPKAWTASRYQQKLKNLAQVIQKLGYDRTHTAPAIVGLAEVENREVVMDLVNRPELKPYNYKIVHFNSLDKRGIDCALIYQGDRFELLSAEPHELEVYNPNGYRDYTRDILHVKGVLDGEEFHFFVNHWPSRSGGALGSNHKRVKAGNLLREKIQDVQRNNPNAKVIAMGDFNDDPNDESLEMALGAKGKKKKLQAGELYNYMHGLHKKGFGTLAYRDRWNLFDQIIVTENLVDRDKKFPTYKIHRTEIFSPSYLVAQEGQYKGYPNRMFGGDTYRADGYSDHFPVFTILIREEN